MPMLKMYIGTMLIDQAQLDYTGLLSCKEKERHQLNIVKELLRQNIEKVKMVKEKPQFFIDRVESKMNYDNTRRIFKGYRADA